MKNTITQASNQVVPSIATDSCHPCLFDAPTASLSTVPISLLLLPPIEISVTVKQKYCYPLTQQFLYCNVTEKYQ